MQQLKTNYLLLADRVHGDIPDWAWGAVESLLQALRIVDSETYFHCLRVGEHSRRLARAMGLSDYLQRVSQFSGILHDIGKMGIDRAILHKPGKLTEEEYQKMKDHSELGEALIQPLSHHDFFAQILPIVRSHHERVDGHGYPDHLHGEDIPLVSRLILVCDTLDAMGQDRAYRKGLPLEVIYQELQKYSGTQFDSAIVREFLKAHAYWEREVFDLPKTSRAA